MDHSQSDSTDVKLFKTEIEIHGGFVTDSHSAEEEAPGFHDDEHTSIHNQSPDTTDLTDAELERLLLLSKRKDSLKEALVERKEFTYAADETFELNMVEPEPEPVDSDKFGFDSHIPYKCVECSKEFSRKSHLTLHKIRMGHGQVHKKNFACTLCDKKYLRKHNLSQHMNVVHYKINPSCARLRNKIHCKHCTRSYFCVDSMSRHMERCHTDGKNYKCKYCGVGFSSHANVGIHIDQVHQVINSQAKL